MPDVPVETLPNIPSAAPLYVRAAATARNRRGSTLPETTLRVVDVAVDRDRLTAYQRITGFPVADALPPTYPWVLAYPVQLALLVRPDVPVPLPGLVHLENHVTAHRVVDAAERLTLDVTATDLRPHRKGRALGVRMTATVAGEPVWECRSVYLSPGRGDASSDVPRADGRPDAPTGPPVARWSLPDGLGREYAAVSGDVNPIHLHPLTARAMGFRRHIAHGMWTAARALAALGRPAAGRGTHAAWFTRPVHLPGTVELVVDRRTERTVAAVRTVDDDDRPNLVLELEPEH